MPLGDGPISGGPISGTPNIVLLAGQGGSRAKANSAVFIFARLSVAMQGRAQGSVGASRNITVILASVVVRTFGLASHRIGQTSISGSINSRVQSRIFSGSKSMLSGRAFSKVVSGAAVKTLAKSKAQAVSRSYVSIGRPIERLSAKSTARSYTWVAGYFKAEVSTHVVSRAFSGASNSIGQVLLRTWSTARAHGAVLPHGIAHLSGHVVGRTFAKVKPLILRALQTRSTARILAKAYPEPRVLLLTQSTARVKASAFNAFTGLVVLRARSTGRASVRAVMQVISPSDKAVAAETTACAAIKPWTDVRPYTLVETEVCSAVSSWTEAQPL